MSTEEPPTKKQRSAEDWENHSMNISEAVVKADEGCNFSEIADKGLETLQGIGPMSKKILDAMGLATVRDLATYKYYLMARAILTLAATETTRPAGSFMNIDNALDKEYETKSLKELLAAPLSALEGLTEEADATLAELHIKTIQDLAEFKYAKWAEAIVELAKYEELKTKSERHLDNALKKLA
ncbi:hypothetical protein ACA910_015777 [Epithemia clementina (nom. ined.)]